MCKINTNLFIGIMRKKEVFLRFRKHFSITNYLKWHAHVDTSSHFFHMYKMYKDFTWCHFLSFYLRNKGFRRPWMNFICSWNKYKHPLWFLLCILIFLYLHISNYDNSKNEVSGLWIKRVILTLNYWTLIIAIFLF